MKKWRRLYLCLDGQDLPEFGDLFASSEKGFLQLRFEQIQGGTLLSNIFIHVIILYFGLPLPVVSWTVRGLNPLCKVRTQSIVDLVFPCILIEGLNTIRKFTFVFIAPKKTMNLWKREPCSISLVTRLFAVRGRTLNQETPLLGQVIKVTWKESLHRYK